MTESWNGILFPAQSIGIDSPGLLEMRIVALEFGSIVDTGSNLPLAEFKIIKPEYFFIIYHLNLLKKVITIITVLFQ